MPTYSIGQKIEVLWNAQWYPAKVLEAGEKQNYLISYDKWSSSYDEVVDLSKIRKCNKESYDQNSILHVDEQVEVNWGGCWYSATIKGIKPCVAKVRYDNFNTSWDTWMPSENIRPSIDTVRPDHSQTIAKSISRLYQTKIFTDLSIRIDGEVVETAHRGILAARCLRFQQLLDTLPSNDSLVIDDLTFETLKSLLQYIYTGSAELLTPSMAVSLYKSAVKYPVEGLEEYCVNFFNKDNSPDSLLTAYLEYQNVSTSSKGVDNMADALLTSMCKRHKEIFRCQQFNQLEKEAVIALVQKITDKLNIN